MTPAPMSEGVTEAMKRLRNACRSVADGFDEFGTMDQEALDGLDKAETAFSRAAEQEADARAPRKEQGAEPVAWRWRYSEDFCEREKSPFGEWLGFTGTEPPVTWGQTYEVRPLYASPNGGREERDEWRPIKTAVKDSHSRMVWCPE